MNRYTYDETDPISIELYAQQLIGRTFADVCNADTAVSNHIIDEITDYDSRHADKRRKGGLGEIIEERFFHYACNNDARPDFEKAGVELKVTPYKINKNGTKAAKERLILTMIDYYTVVNETFENSHLWTKAQLLLIIYYLYQKELENRLDYRIDYAKLFTPPKEDLEIIKQDFYRIVKKVQAGKAHELSEGDTLYLGAAPKAATSSDRRKQPFSYELAKPRAFAFKNSYMTYVLNNYIIPGKQTYERIVPVDETKPFEAFVQDKINSFKGYSIEELCREFSIDFTKPPKNLESMLAFRILGIKGNHAEEFEKANIVVKSIRIEKTNKIKESMSFPTFKFKELVEEEWEDSTFGTYLSETRFLFVVYRYSQDNSLRLQGCQFWNIPFADLENDVQNVWRKTKQVLIDGLKITYENGVRRNNFPKASENRVCHVRPHAKNAQDTYELPDGRLYPKQCFWLNNTYIYSQIEPELKK